MTVATEVATFDFSLDFYRDILRFVRTSFDLYLFRDLRDVEDVTSVSGCLMRHDVDIDIQKALECARIEYQEGVKSTYFIIPNWPLYSLNDTANVQALEEIMALGHEIGLHFNLDRMRRKETTLTPHAMLDEIELDGLKLSEVLNTPVRSLSFHRPWKTAMRGELFLAGYVNAYSEVLMRWYLSDSRGRWREGNPIASMQNPKGPLLQLLTHPIWWGEQSLAPVQSLQEFFLTATRAMQDEERAAFDTHLANALSIRRNDARV